MHWDWTKQTARRKRVQEKTKETDTVTKTQFFEHSRIP